jgi:hypothetical protein
MKSRPVHPLEEFTRKTFGERFAAIILRGLDVEDDVGDEEFRLSCQRINEAGAMVETTLSVIAPLAERAGEYHPLILAAILKLLLSRRDLTHDLHFTFKEGLCCKNYFQAGKSYEVISLCCYSEQRSNKLRLSSCITSG